MNEYILEPAINVEVMDRANVLVIGAGPAGCAAAIAAARAGETVLRGQVSQYLVLSPGVPVLQG